MGLHGVVPIAYSMKPYNYKGHPERGQTPNKGQAESTHVYTLYRKSPLKEDNLSTKRTKLLVPKLSFIKRFLCSMYMAMGPE